MEQDFIQLCFMQNRMLLDAEFRPLFDALKERYAKVWNEGRDYGVDLMATNNKFLESL